MENKRNNLLESMANRIMGIYSNPQEVDKPKGYILGRDGIYTVINNSIGTFVEKTQDFTKEIPVAPQLKPYFEFKLPKIPFELFIKTFTFFKDICNDNRNEVMVIIYYDRNNKNYILDVPTQIVSQTHISYNVNTELETDPNIIRVLDIHSHNIMGAFFSGTDDKDESEKGTQFFGVIGKLDTPSPEVKVRYCVDGKFKEIQLYDIFDINLDISLNSMKVDVPKTNNEIMYFLNMLFYSFKEKYQEDISQFKTKIDYRTHYFDNFDKNTSFDYTYKYNKKDKKNKKYEELTFEDFVPQKQEKYEAPFELDDKKGIVEDYIDFLYTLKQKEVIYFLDELMKQDLYIYNNIIELFNDYNANVYYTYEDLENGNDYTFNRDKSNIDKNIKRQINTVINEIINLDEELKDDFVVRLIEEFQEEIESIIG